MSNWISNHSKSKRRHIFSLFLSLVLLLNATSNAAQSLSINVYLKYKPENSASELIKTFNHYLDQKALLKNYSINPFINEYPLHTTLYLAHYEQKQLPLIMHQIKQITKQQKPLVISIDQLEHRANNYVMLGVKKDPELTQLSQRIVNALAPLRNKKTKIPTWAAKDKERQQLFKHYGSPNVLHKFHPHFSIFGPLSLNEPQNVLLEKQLLPLIDQFQKIHSMQISVTSYAIGVGVANAQGQIIEELGVFWF